MKTRSFLLILLLAAGSAAYAQKKDTVTNLDQLQSPSSPAFNMLGLSPTEIQRPENPTDFAFSLSNASNNFSTIPKSYALEIAPFWVFGGKTSFKDFMTKNSPSQNILQTMVFSLGTTTATSLKDSSQFRRIAFSLKFSIYRGHVASQFKKWNDSLDRFLSKYVVSTDSIKQQLVKNDPVLKNITSDPKWASDPAKQKRYQAEMDSIDNKARATAAKLDASAPDRQALVKQLNTLAGEVNFKRYGFKMDGALGTVLDYPDSTFSQCYLSKFAAWLTLGWEKEKGLNVMTLFRYTLDLNRYYRNDNNQLVNDVNLGGFDCGLRVYEDVNSKMTLSLEYLNKLPFYNKQNYLTNHITTPGRTDKYDFSLNYKVGKNQSLSFTYGKDFDNKINKSGNLIAAVNFIIGLGSNRGSFGN